MPLDDIKKVRLEKLDELKKAGVDPYPAKSWRTQSIHDVLSSFDELAQEKRQLVVAGRIMAHREHGGSTFIDIDDGTAVMQAFLKKDVIGAREYELFLDTTDIGDFIEISGSVFLTKQKERTIEAQKYRILTKTLLPLPEKWHGLQDIEERFRKRYLDLLFNPDVRKKFQMRAQIIQSMRDFMNENGFLEVTTPTLQPLYGGASARPFKTHMHALDIDVYLRIAPELYLKRLLVGGFNAVYEFTTNFRNEGIDREHNPEFSGLEFYIAYKDHTWAMEYTEKLFAHVLTAVRGATEITYEGNKIDFKAPYARRPFRDLLKEHVGIEYDYADEEDFRTKAKELGVTIEKIVSKAGLADELFKKVVRPKLLQPTFVIEYPVELLPLAKREAGGENVAAFQFFAAGTELIKAYSELNDPLDQRERFAAQEAQRAKGDEEAQRMDEDFVQALEYGMPPAAGWGLGVDRFVAILTNSHSLREVMLFPFMRPKTEEK